jgi:hypothetical protein
MRRSPHVLEILVHKPGCLTLRVSAVERHTAQAITVEVAMVFTDAASIPTDNDEERIVMRSARQRSAHYPSTTHKGVSDLLVFGAIRRPIPPRFGLI